MAKYDPEMGHLSKPSTQGYKNLSHLKLKLSNSQQSVHGGSVSFALVSTSSNVACSRRSDNGARAKKKASERAGKNPSLPSFFPALSLAFFFARAPLSERLEQASPKVAFTRLIAQLKLFSRYK